MDWMICMCDPQTMTMAGNVEFKEMHPDTIFAFIPQVYRNSREHLGTKKGENIHNVISCKLKYYVP